MQWRIQDFPWGGVDLLGGRGPLTWVLFCENVCKNERTGSLWKACTGHVPPRSPNAMYPSGGSRISHRGDMHPLGGCGPPMQVLFGENVCKNERTGSLWRTCAGHGPLDPPMLCILNQSFSVCYVRCEHNTSTVLLPLIGTIHLHYSQTVSTALTF